LLGAHDYLLTTATAASAVGSYGDETVVAAPGFGQARPVRRDIADDRATRAAVVADVHGNATAMEAVAAEIARERPDAVIFLGDLTWGPLPEETWDVVVQLQESVSATVWFIRGNAERALVELQQRPASGDPTARESWMLEQHRATTLAALEAFLPAVCVTIDGLGRARFCHGSPRSDEELVTPATPAARMRALLGDVAERVLVTAHTHIQFDRVVAGIRSVNPGSVGMPYQGEPGAYWAMLGPDVELRRTEYDLEGAVARYRATSDPLAEATIATLLQPPTPEQVILHAEALEFSG
jgi:predicted phosphodiesterase